MTAADENAALYERCAEHLVEVWVFQIDQEDTVVEQLRSTLSQDELARAARFLDPAHQHRFIVGRGRLRQILAHDIGNPPSALNFTATKTGKPFLRAPTRGPHFNLSHSGGTAALGVCRTSPLGIDIESIRIVHDGLAQRFFAASEVTELNSLPDTQQQQAFFRCWTRKEAFLKATGEGIARGLDSFQVALNPDEPARIKAIDNNAEAARAWKLLDFDPGPEMLGSIALQVPHARLQLRSLDELIR